MKKLNKLVVGLCTLGMFVLGYNANAGFGDSMRALVQGEAEYKGSLGAVAGRVAALKTDGNVDDTAAGTAYVNIAGIYKFSFNVMQKKSSAIQFLAEEVANSVYTDSKSPSKRLATKLFRTAFQQGYEAVARPLLGSFIANLELMQAYAAELVLVTNAYVDLTQAAATSQKTWSKIQKVQETANEYAAKAQAHVDGAQALMFAFDDVFTAIKSTDGNSDELAAAVANVHTVADASFGKDTEAFYAELHATFGGLVEAGFTGVVVAD